MLTFYCQEGHHFIMLPLQCLPHLTSHDSCPSYSLVSSNNYLSVAPSNHSRLVGITPHPLLQHPFGALFQLAFSITSTTSKLHAFKPEASYLAQGNSPTATLLDLISTSNMVATLLSLIYFFLIPIPHRFRSCNSYSHFQVALDNCAMMKHKLATSQSQGASSP